MSDVDNPTSFGFQPFANRTLSDLAFASIEKAIVTGQIAPGSKISEVELARTFGISRGSLREALRRLEGRKLIQRVPHVGVRVIRLDSRQVLDAFRVREALEGMACRLAAEHMSEGDLDELQRVLEGHRQSEPVQRGDAYFQDAGDFDFHYRIAVGSRNAKLRELLCEDLYYPMRVYRYQSGAAPGRAQEAMKQHYAILAALRDRDGEKAEHLMRQHIADARAILQAASGPDGAETAEAAQNQAGGTRKRALLQEVGK
jgi:DNA-binding GntR family transcriptional regulator